MNWTVGTRTRQTLAVIPAVLILLWPGHLVGRAERAASGAFSISAVGPVGGSYDPELIDRSGQIVGTVVGRAGVAFYVYKRKAHAGEAGDCGFDGYEFMSQDDTGGLLGQGCGGTTSGQYAIGNIRSGKLTWTVQSFPSTAYACYPWALGQSGEVSGGCGTTAEGYTYAPVYWIRGSNGYGNPVQEPIPPRYSALSPGNGVHGVDAHGDFIGRETESPPYGSEVAVLWTRKPDGFHLLAGLAEAEKVPWRTNDWYDTWATALVYRRKVVDGAPSAQITVVGQCLTKLSTRSQHYDPCLWRVRVERGKVVTGKAVKLDRFDGVPACGCGEANGVNKSGWVVGNDGSAYNTPSLWIPHSKRYKELPLGSLLSKKSGWTFPPACMKGHGWGPTDINDKGQIVGLALYKGKPTGFLMTPRGSLRAVAARLSKIAAAGGLRRQALQCATK